MSARVDELAEMLGASYVGDGGKAISCVLPYDRATPESITFLARDRTVAKEGPCTAGAIIRARGCDPLDIPTLFVPEPLEAALRLAAFFRPPVPKPAPGIHALAAVDPTAKICPSVHVGPFAVVEADVVIGEGTVLHPHAVVRTGCRLGRDVEIHPHAVLYPFTVIGDRSVIHSGVVVGCDGFGYVPNHPVHTKIPQLGHVEIAEDVEIGANSCVDRATLGATTIGASTKIDDQVMIGHNCRIGPRNLLAAHTGLAGSVSTGDMVWMAGKVGVADHVAIGDGCVLMAFAGIHKDVPSGARQMGVPARDVREFALESAALGRLPKLLKVVHEIRRRLDAIAPPEKKVA